jgi:hypothetical protein
MKYIVTLAALAGCCAGCAKHQAEPDKGPLRQLATSFVPSDAIELRKSSDVPWVQMDFQASRGPKEFAVATERLAKARSDGWLLCEPTDSAWTEFDDLSVQPRRYIAERSFMLYKADTLVVLLGRYEFENKTAWEYANQTPAARLVQHAVIIAQPSSEDDARTRASEQGLQCS